MSEPRPDGVAEATARLMNMVATLAAPQVHQRLLATSSCGELFHHVEEHIEPFLETVGSASIVGAEREVDTSELARMTIELRDLLRAQSGTDAVSPEIIAKARAWFSTIGFGEPPGGWDAFTGEP